MKYFAEVLRVFYQRKPKAVDKVEKPRSEKFYLSENGSLLPNKFSAWNKLIKKDANDSTHKRI